jgi:hypothetical protein
MFRSAGRLLIAIAACAITGCTATSTPNPPASPARSPSNLATVSLTVTNAPSPTSSVALDGYLATRLDAGQFSGVALDSVALRPDGRWLGLGNWLTATRPDGSPRQPTIWTTADGLSWTRQADSPAFVSRRAFWEEGVFDVIETGHGFVAVGTESEDDSSRADAAAWFSPDGVTWTRATVNDAIGRTMEQVVATSGGLVALGEAAYSFHAGFGGGTAIWTSRDGRVWTRLSDEVGPPHGTRLRTVVRRPGGFLATATFEDGEGVPDAPRPPLTAGIWTSNDGIHWQPIPGTPLGLNDLIRTPVGYIAVGSGVGDHSAHALAWTSTDSRIWTSAVLPLPADLPTGASALVQRVASGPTGFIAFGARDDTFSPLDWSSPDGEAWVPIDLEPALGGAIVDELLRIGDSLLLSGHLDRSDGTREAMMWLLRPR